MEENGAEANTFVLGTWQPGSAPASSCSGCGSWSRWA